MSSYLKEAVKKIGEHMEPAVTLARSDLFVLDHSSPFVDEKREKLFHRLVHKLLCCSCRGGKILIWRFISIPKELKMFNEGDYSKFRRSLHYVCTRIRNGGHMSYTHVYRRVLRRP